MKIRGVQIREEVLLIKSSLKELDKKAREKHRIYVVLMNLGKRHSRVNKGTPRKVLRIHDVDDKLSNSINSMYTDSSACVREN